MRTYLKGLCLSLCALTFTALALASETPSVAVSPGYTVIGTSASVQYIATVTGLANTDVTWEINRVVGGNATLGTISASGLYKAPTVVPTGDVLIIAVASDNQTEGAEYVVVEPAGPPITAISPGSILIGTYTITLRGSNFQPGAAIRNGVTDDIATTFVNSTTLTATSFQGTAGTGSFQVMNPGSLWGPVFAVPFVSPSISPASATVKIGASQQFTSTGATSWTASAGTISSTGLYTAPAALSSTASVTVTAAGHSGSAVAAVTLTAPPAPTLSPGSASVLLGQTLQFTSAGATSSTVSAGTLSSSYLYTAPTSMTPSGIATVTVTGPGGSAAATVTLIQTQSISPTSASVVLGQTQQFTSAGATRWAASAGTVSATGLYTAPSAMPASSSATVTAVGAGGSASAAVMLIAAPTTAQTSTTQQPISISTQNPAYGWQVIPGATRRIHATVTNGTSNQVTWSYTTTGGATATLTPAPSPNVLGAFVDVTVGPVGGACTDVGTATAPSFSSPQSITLIATSVDDRSKSVSVPIQICNPTIQAFVSPFNIRLYSGQTVDLQSWVWGTVNDNVTWTITQPSGGNGSLKAPPAGGSAMSARDAVFSANAAGDYTVTATSVANPAISASAIVSVDSAPMPAYAVTPNHTEPVDCSVDPAQTGKTYDIGPGHPYPSFAAAYVAIGSTTLNPGTTIRLFNSDTTGTNPTRYPEYLRVDGQGTEAAPIRIVGCADSAGNLPVLDAASATAYSPTDNSAVSGIAGLYQIAVHHSGAFGLYPTMSGPAYVSIEGIAFRNAYPTANSGTSNYYYAPGSSTATQWGSSASCIRPYEGDHITIRGNDMEDCGFGVLADFNGNNAWGGFFGDFDLQGNYFTNIGAANVTEHMAYVQGYRQVIQGNFFDQLKSVSQAGELKMRGVAEVVRYNAFNTSTNTRTIDFVDEQDSNMYMSFTGYYFTPPGSMSFRTEYPTDAYTPDMLAAADEAYHKAYVYGNIVNFGPGTPTSAAPVHFFADLGESADPASNAPVRVGDLFDYSNTFYSVGNAGLHLVDTMQNGDNETRSEWPALTLWNNAIYVGSLNTYAGQGFQMSTLRSDFYNLGPNWLSSNWGNNTLTCTNNQVGACVGTGWPYQTETTQYMDGGNLPAHITGLSNLITGGSTVPFSTTTWVPTSGGGLVGAGATLPGSITNMPVRSQMSGYTLVPRSTPLTLGAHD